MIELRTLGETDLRSRGDGRRFRSVLAQPKRFALLAYLAVEHPAGFVRRDYLLALFWPELPESRARAALRSSLYRLRRSLGKGVLLGRGDEEVGIEAERLRCDAVAFEDAVEAGRLEEALELYRGEFLTGFHLPAVPAFERWLDGVRQRLRRTASRSALRLEEDAEEARDPEAAAGWARRALEIDPFDERALRRLLVLLDRRGNRAEAVRTWERFAARLESDLGVEPAPETREVADLIEARDQPAPDSGRTTHRESGGGAESRPGTARAELHGEENLAPDSEDEPGRSARAGEVDGRTPGGPLARFGRRAAAVTLALLGVAGAAFVLSRTGSGVGNGPGTPPAAASPERVLVADLGVQGADTLLADAVAEALRIGLAQRSGVRVASQASVREALRRMRREPGPRLGPEVAREVAIREGIGALLTGRLQKAGPGYVITVSLVKARTGEIVDGWVETASDSQSLGPTVAELAAGVSRHVADRLGSRELTGDVEDDGSRYPELTTPSLPALRKYAQAERAFLDGDVLRTVDLAQEAIALDSSFAAAHLRLAHALATTYMSRGRELEALSRAFQLRAQLPDAERYFVAGNYHRMAANLPAAMESFRSAADASEGRLGDIFIGVILIQTRDLDEAVRIFRKGRETTDIFVHDELLIRTLHRQGRIEQARRLLREAERDFPDHPVFAELRVELARAAGEYARADSLAARIPMGGSVGLAERHPMRHQAINDGIRGRYGDALRHLRQLRELQLERGMGEPAWNTTLYAARLHAARGDPGAGVAEVDEFRRRVPLDSLHPLGRPYIQLPLADFYVEAGRPDRARNLLEAYDRTVRPAWERPGRARRHLVEAKLDAAEGRSRATLENLSRALTDVEVRGQFDYDLPIQVPVGDRPEVARIYESMGLPDSAIAVYQRYLENRALRRSWLDAHELGAALERLAELLESRGRPREAARLYRRLGRLWAEADPQLRPRVRQALRRARSLEELAR